MHVYNACNSLYVHGLYSRKSCCRRQGSCERCCAILLHGGHMEAGYAKLRMQICGMILWCNGSHIWIFSPKFKNVQNYKYPQFLFFPLHRARNSAVNLDSYASRAPCILHPIMASHKKAAFQSPLLATSALLLRLFEIVYTYGNFTQSTLPVPQFIQ